MLAGCTSYESRYEKGVYDLEPIYCYQTIGAVDCHRQPDARDADRLVNYYGPAPSKYDPPDPPHLNKLRAPPKGQGYWRAPEPVPGPPVEAGEDDANDGAGAGAPADTPTAPQSRPGNAVPEDAGSGPRSPASPPPFSPPQAPPAPTLPAPAPADTPAAEQPKAT